MNLPQSRAARIAAVVAICALGVYGFVYFDVVSRAKDSYQKAEMYMEWNKNPAQKKAFYDARYERDKAALDVDLSKGKISQEDYKLNAEALAFDRDFAINESSLKYAYQYYKDTYELFSPPESKWVKLARVKTPETLELWKAELREQKVPFEDTNFE